VSETWLAIVYSVIAGMSNVLGGALVVIRRVWSQRGLKMALAFGGGFMLGATLLGMVPESIHLMPRWGAAIILLGYLFIHFLEHVVGGHYHFAGDQHGSHRLISPTVTAATVFALTVHTFFDGVAIASAFYLGERIGTIILIAVVIHKFPAGFATSTVLIANGASRLRAFGGAALLGIMTVLGATAVSFAGRLEQYAVPISAGTLLHVAASDLIPEVNEGERWPITLMVVFGGAFFIGVRMLLGGKLD
jgi:ZIP family zinc transporter/zinc and cadmium transporter